MAEGFARHYIKHPRHPRAAAPRSWTVPQLAAAYNFPRLQGRPVKLAIGELGGGWTQSDLAKNFDAVGYPLPKIIDVSVDPGARNMPGGDADYEVMLDIVCMAQAFFYITHQPADISIYYANNDAGGIERAIRRAMLDGMDVMAWSWGTAEGNWTDAQGTFTPLDGLQSAALTATGAGMLLTAASGDNDADDNMGGVTVDAPASCPNFIACGGTTKLRTKVWQPRYEYPWNNNPGRPNGEGTGGGVSGHFPRPAWQIGGPAAAGRIVPDLVALADPNTGYPLYIHGNWTVIGGTSAVAPLMGGYFGAVLGQKPGFILDKLWANHLPFWDIQCGAGVPVCDNGYYHALPGPDLVSGLGVPRGTWLASVLGALPMTARK